MKKKNQKGEITVFLSLVFVLLFSFIGGLLESASIQISKNYRRTNMDKAMHSIFAEYQKNALAEYNIFTLEGSYETGEYSEGQILKRLEYYGAAINEQEITKVQLLTDNCGYAFKEQAIFYMKNKLGIDIMQNVLGTTPSWKEMKIQGEEFQETEQITTQELDSQLEGAGAELEAESNPLDTISNIKQSNILQIVMPKSGQLSNKSIILENQPSQRTLKKGKGVVQISKDAEGELSSLLVGEYLLEHFAQANNPNESGALSYELEYLLEGKSSDQQNLEAVVKKILLMRTGPNYLYLQTDATKKAEAKALGLTIASAAAVPVLAEVVTQAIIAAWAFGESIIDIRSLLNNKKVPLVKNSENWQLQLTSLLKLGTNEDMEEGKDNENGLAYKEYLRILLFLEKENNYIMKALDIVESNMEIEKGLTFFRVDQCINKLEVESTCNLKRGITYRFPSYFGYQ